MQLIKVAWSNGLRYRPFKPEMLSSILAATTYGGLVKWFTIPDSQSGDVGFDSHIRYCDYSTKVSTVDCGSIDLGSIPSSYLGNFIRVGTTNW